MKVSTYLKALTMSMCCLMGSSFALADLLGVLPEAPAFEYNSGGVTTFTSVDGKLSVVATPLTYTVDGVTVTDIFALTVNPSVTMSVLLDTSCALTGGDPGGDDLVIVGDIDLDSDFSPEFSGTLLTGEILELGVNTVGTDSVALYDAKFSVTGGELVTAGHYSVGDKIGMTLRSEGSDFANDCTVDSSGGAKGDIGLLPVVEPPEKCYDIKKLWFQDSVAYRQCYGYGGSYGSKYKVKLAAECESNFDPTNDLISVSLDGETIEFPPGSFDQDVDNLSVFNAQMSGRPSVSAVLNCSEGWFSLVASRADISQIDFSDGVDVRLILGTWDKTMNAPVTPHQSYNGYNLTWKYWNPAPADCSNPDYEPPACETQWESVKFKHVGSGDFFHYDGNFGSSIVLNHEYADEGAATCSAMAEVDSSCGTTVTCGDVIGGFKVMKIEHKDDSQSCDITTHHGRYHDRWSWKRSRHH